MEGPCLIVANHVTNWDPLLLAMSFPDDPHPLRGQRAHLPPRLDFAPAGAPGRAHPAAQGLLGGDTVKAVLRALKDGELVCLFAEGDATWDGLTHPVFPATGKMARSAGAALMTYRLEGGYLAPRWSGKLSPGKMRGARGRLSAGGAQGHEGAGDHRAHRPRHL